MERDDLPLACCLCCPGHPPTPMCPVSMGSPWQWHCVAFLSQSFALCSDKGCAQWEGLLFGKGTTQKKAAMCKRLEEQQFHPLTHAQ